MKCLLFISVLSVNVLILCGCSTKDDVILATPSDHKETLVSSNNGTEQTTSAVELENRFKGCKAHW